MKTTLITVAANLAAARGALAAVPATPDGPGLLTVLFLGFGALIVVAQVMPAVMMMIGMAKGLSAEKKEAETRK